MAALTLMCSCLRLLTLSLLLAGASQLACARSQRGILNSKLGSQKRQVVRTSLLHRDHPDSPLSVPFTSTAERYHAAAERQSARTVQRRGLVEFNTSLVSAIVPEAIEEYVMTLYLGTPAQRFFLIMDTGSDLLWVQCLPCLQCYNETNPYFDPTQSTTYAAITCDACSTTLAGSNAFCNVNGTCEIDYAYAEAGSFYAGVLSTETISFNDPANDPSVPNILFGCMDNNTLSFGHVDGFAGFGRGAFSLPNQLGLLNSTNVFSYCLVSFDVSDSLASSLIFGVPDQTNSFGLVYTAILTDPNPTFYWASLTGFAINGVALDLLGSPSLVYNPTTHSGGTFFDSGTTNTVLTTDIFTIFTAALTVLIPYPMTQVNNQLCFNTTGVPTVVYPTVTLHFLGLDNTTTVDFVLSPENLFLSAGDNFDCLAVDDGGVTGNNIIGNVAQADHYIETDLENLKIGWTTKDCSVPM